MVAAGRAHGPRVCAGRTHPPGLFRDRTSARPVLRIAAAAACRFRCACIADRAGIDSRTLCAVLSENDAWPAILGAPRARSAQSRGVPDVVEVSQCHWHDPLSLAAPETRADAHNRIQVRG